MSLRNYQKKTKPALWTTMPGGSKPRALNVRPELARQKREARRMEANRKARIRSARRKPVRSRSKAMSSKMVIYHRLRAEFLREHCECMACAELCAVIDHHQTLSGLPQFQTASAAAFRLRQRRSHRHPATEIHHKFGRAGNRLLDTSGWAAVCAEAHRFIHDNPLIGTAAGMLGGKGEWNSP